MKKTIKIGTFAFVATLVLASCKKDRVCECTLDGETVPVRTYKNSKKKDAEEKCNFFDFQLSYADGSCELK